MVIWIANLRVNLRANIEEWRGIGGEMWPWAEGWGEGGGESLKRQQMLVWCFL